MLRYISVGFTPLHRGTLDSIRFYERKSNSKPFDPLHLPDYKDQCAHVEAVITDGQGIRHERCTNSAKGWLCPQHDRMILSKRININEIPVRDYDQEAVDHVKLTESKALANVKREVFGLKHKIQFVDGVRMSSSPDIEVEDDFPHDPWLL